MNILLLSGSFHKKSITLALLNVVANEMNNHGTACETKIETVMPAINELPFYSEDLAGIHKPKVVQDFLEQVSKADGIVCCTPEYNHSIPAVLKNAIDWASRPAFNSPLKDLPVTIVTQAVSPVGGARAQAHLKLVLDSTLSRVHLCHEMMVTGVDQKFDENLELVDDKTSERIRRHLASFIEFIG